MGFVVFPNWNLPPILPQKVKMFQNECFVIMIKKTKTMVICRLILGIFGDFQNFQISRFQKIWKVSGNSCFWQIATYWVFFPLSFGHWVWFFTQNFCILNFQEFPDSRFQKIWKVSGNYCFWPISTYWVFFPLSFGHWAWFWAQNFKIPIFLDFSGISGYCLEIYKLWPFLQSGTYFPLNFGHWVWFST